MTSHAIGEEIIWTPSQSISTDDVDASSPAVGVDSNGNLVALWIEQDAIYSSVKPIDQDWTTPVAISNTGASSPALFVDPNGNATAVWVESSGVCSSYLPFGGSWEPEQTISQAGGVSPQIAGNSGGDVVAIWSRSGNIESSTRLFDGSWPIDPNVLSVEGTCDFPQVAIGADNSVFAVWHAVVNTPSPLSDVIYAASKTISGSWGVASVISDTSYHSAYPHIAVDDNGNALALWYRYLLNPYYNSVGVQSAEQASGGSWSPPITHSTSGVMNPARLMARVAFDSFGNAIAAWTQSYDGQNFTLEQTVKFPGYPLDGLQTLVSNFYAYAFDLKINTNGEAYLVYMTYNAAAQELRIQGVEADIAGTRPMKWNYLGILSSGVSNGFPVLASSLNGVDVHLGTLWLCHNGTNQVIQARAGLGELLEAPTGLAVTQSSTDYGVTIDYYNIVTWNPSTSIRAAGYSIYRNGTFLTEVGANTLRYEDHNQAQSASVTYGISTIDVDYSQGPIATVSFP